MRIALGAFTALALLTPALAEDVQVELNTLENTDNNCRMTFVIENKSKTAVDSLKLDLVLFNTDGAVFRRMIVDMAPVRAAKTVVKAFVTAGDCTQLSKVLVNEVTACTPGDAATCQDQLALKSRLKNVQLYKESLRSPDEAQRNPGTDTRRLSGPAFRCASCGLQALT